MMKAFISSTIEQHKISPTLDYSLVQKYVLLRSHPRSIIIESVGFIWGLYYVWLRDWRFAIIAVVLAKTWSLWASARSDLGALAETTLGKLALLHLHPLNIIIQLVGLLILIQGFWMHSFEEIFVGFSVVLLGHLFGWENVNPKFSL